MESSSLDWSSPFNASLISSTMSVVWLMRAPLKTAAISADFFMERMELPLVGVLPPVLPPLPLPAASLKRPVAEVVMVGRWLWEW